GGGETVGLLRASWTIALEPTVELFAGRRVPGLLVHWCGPPVAGMPEDQRAQIQSFIQPDGAADVVSDRAPAPLIQIGMIDAPLLPAPVKLPFDNAALIEEVTSAVSQLLAVRRLLGRLESGDSELGRYIDDGNVLLLLEQTPAPVDLWLRDQEDG